MNEFLNSLFNWRIGAKTDIIFQVLNIGIGSGDIPGLKGEIFLARLPSQTGFQGLNKVHELHAVIVANIV